MPRYHHLRRFMTLVKHANPNFERFIKSDLHGLIEELDDPNGSAHEVQRSLRALRAEKVAKYRDAIWYLQATYPGVTRMPLEMGDLKKTNAARYPRTALPPNYDPRARPPILNRPNSTWLNQTVEQFLLATPGTTGIILIHLSNFQPPMADVFDNRRVVDHMNSVLRIGQLCGCDLLCLHMDARSLCPELEEAASLFQARTNVHVTPEHMGGRNLQFQQFARGHDNLVIMGFDADICVHANLFGCQNCLPDGNFIPPLTSITNVVTSRAVLVTAGKINGFKTEYGVLTGQ